MITQYPEKASLKEVLSTSLSLGALKAICKSNGIFLLSSDKDILIRDAHLFYWGYEDINSISNYLEDEKNYKKSFRLKLKFNPQENAEENISMLQELSSLITIYRNNMAISDRITFNSFQFQAQATEQILVGEVSYEKRKPGKVELLAKTIQRFNFQAKQSGADSIDIDFIFGDRSDISIAKKMITTALAGSTNFGLPIQISLKALTISERVELFDRFFGYQFHDWKLESIQGIKISDSQELLDDEDEQDNITESILNGIKSALFNGSGLRSNPIIIQAVDKGYFFPKATIMFEHRREAKKVLIDVAFSSDELLLEINIVTTFEVEDDHPYKTPFLTDEQKEILEGFHDVMQSIYTEIRLERSVDDAEQG